MRYYKHLKSGGVWCADDDWSLLYAPSEYIELSEADYRNYYAENLPRKIFGLVVRTAPTGSSFCKFWYISRDGHISSCSWLVAQATGFKVKDLEVIVPNSDMCPIHHALTGLPCNFERIY